MARPAAKWYIFFVDEATVTESMMGDNPAEELLQRLAAVGVGIKARIQDLEQSKDAAYAERNQCVALIATMALKLGWTAGITRTAIDGWDPCWHNCVYIDLPTGQVSWHYHDREAALFAHLPPYIGTWDGHDTEEKYRRCEAVAEKPKPTLAIDSEKTAAIEGLPPRTRQVLKLMALGYSNKEIARSLGMLEGTVKEHMKTIMHGLAVPNRTRAAILYNQYEKARGDHQV